MPIYIFFMCIIIYVYIHILGGLPTSNNLIKKISQRFAHELIPVNNQD